MASKEEMKKQIDDQIKALQDELKKIDDLFAGKTEAPPEPQEEHHADRPRTK